MKVKQSQVKPGSIVRLIQPFHPDPQKKCQYQFAVVVGIPEGEAKSQSLAQPSIHHSESEVIVYLYDLERNKPYLDEWGKQAWFCFTTTEVEPFHQNSLRSPSIPASHI